MLICNKCNKQYNEGLRFCPTCGSELTVMEKKEEPKEETVTTVKGIGAQTHTAEPTTDVTTAPESAPAAATNNSMPSVGEKCPNCGASIEDSEKFCIRCGTPVNAVSVAITTEKKTISTQTSSGLQSELTKAFRSNKFFEFLWKYAIVFALYYPIYLLLGRIESLSGLVEVLEYISIFGFYTYYIGLIALYSKKEYLPILIAFGIRFLNSFVLFQTEVPISSLCRIAVLAVAFIFIFKEFMTTGQYQSIKSNFETKPCPHCGTSVKANDRFCPKCGNRMRG